VTIEKSPRQFKSYPETRAPRRFVELLVFLGFACLLGGLEGCGGTDNLQIESAILRNRVVVLDGIIMKKVLYVAFSMGSRNAAGRSFRIQGRLVHDGSVLSESAVFLHSERTGNLVFDLPYEIPDGPYVISMQAVDEHGNVIGRGSQTVERSTLWSGAGVPPEPTLESIEESPLPREEAGGVLLTGADKDHGYVLFARSPLIYVYPDSKPKRDEVIRSLSAQAVRNATVTLSVAIYPARTLGNLRISVSDLKSKDGILPSDQIRMACVDSVPDATGAPKGTFRYIPELLRPISPKGSIQPDCRRLWITIKVGREVVPGEYSGKLTLVPERAASTELPITLTITSIVLEDVPSVDYCMLMTYEFTELTMPWSEEEKLRIRAAAAAVLRDYKNHGMTTLCLHSPFVLMTGRDGMPALDDIFDGLRAVRDAGFKRPIVWYMGHLVQTSKPRHPGNIRGFDENTHLERLRYLVKTVSEHARAHGYPEVIFLPIDEPDDANQDIEGRRRSITPLLVKTIKESGARSMVTGERYDQLGRPDYLVSSRLDRRERDRAHADGARYWVYENKVTMQCTSPVFARYQYGYFAWQNDLDGLSSWTFQNTQNAAGPPGQANPSGRSGLDVYLTYPAPHGPVSTIKWEAIREGIEDYKLVYQLVKRVNRMKAKGMDAREYQAFLHGLKTEQLEPCCDATLCKAREARAFEQRRDALIAMILRAEEGLR